MVDAGQTGLLFQVQPGAERSSAFKMESKADCKAVSQSKTNPETRLFHTVWSNGGWGITGCEQDSKKMICLTLAIQKMVLNA